MTAEFLMFSPGATVVFRRSLMLIKPPTHLTPLSYFSDPRASFFRQKQKIIVKVGEFVPFVTQWPQACHNQLGFNTRTDFWALNQIVKENENINDNHLRMLKAVIFLILQVHLSLVLCAFALWRFALCFSSTLSIFRLITAQQSRFEFTRTAVTYVVFSVNDGYAPLLP
jgi:hypothetical protein